MKTPMPKILGNEKLKSRLCSDILEGTSAHAYIFLGAKGSGKHTLAMQCAAAVACEKKGDLSAPLPCGNCPTCRKILAGKSPDVITISKDGASIKIKQMRELPMDVRKYPVDLEDKFYIIEDAHTMTEDAQDAFLQTLEEPPAFVHFFLLCESEEPLLETIRSRAPLLRTEPIPAERIRAYLKENTSEASALSKEAFDQLLSIANGSIGRAKELLSTTEREPLVKLRQTAEALVQSALEKNTAGLIEQINLFPKKHDELLPIFASAQTALRDLIALKQDETAPLCFYVDRAEALELTYRYSRSALFKLADLLAEADDRLQKNANAKLTLTAMIAKL